VVIRAIAFKQFGDSVYGRVLLHDALEYYNLASQFAEGHWQQKTAFFLGPGWPGLLGLWFKITGASIAAGRVLNVLLSAVTMVLVARVTHVLAGRIAAVYAACIWASYGPAIFHEQTMLMEIAAGAFSLATLAMALRVHGRADIPIGSTRHLLGCAATGLMLGISALFRANSLAMAPVLMLALIVDGRRRGNLKGAIGGGVIAIVACLATFAPTAMHNWRAEQEIIPITSNFGLNFYIGFSPRATGAYFIPPSADAEPRGLPAARLALNRDELSSGEISKYWSSEAKKFIAENPGKAAELVARRALMLLNAREIPQIYFPERMGEAEIPALRYARLVAYWIVLPFAFLGGIAAWHSNRRGTRVHIACVVMLMLSLLPFFITGRYRLPIAPFLVVLAAIGIANILSAFRARNPGAIARLVAPGLLTGILVWPAWLESGGGKDAAYRFDEIRSALYLQDGNTAKAEELLRAIPEDQAGPTALNRLAKIAEEERKDYCAAADLYERAIQQRPFVPQYWFNAGQARLRCSQTLPPGDERAAAMLKAQNAFERALQLNPDLPESAWINLAGLKQVSGDTEGARATLRALLTRHPESKMGQQRLSELQK
jgi:4-amino-4-deoxy-L-arabinose transferase-like glycosyltransferase